MSKLIFGARVRVKDKYRRRQMAAMDRTGMWLKWWEPFPVNPPREGIYIGRRTLADGKADYIGSEEGIVFCADKYYPAALVVFSERERPVLVPLDAIESE